MEGKTVLREKGHYRRRGVIGYLGCTCDVVTEDGYVSNQTARENERYSWRNGLDGRFYRMRCFRVPELHRVWYTGSPAENRTAISDAKERVGKKASGNKMGADKFGRLIGHLVDNYDAGGKTMVLHIDNDSRHSRGSAHWVSRTEVEEGKIARRGEQRMVGGWGRRSA